MKKSRVALPISVKVRHAVYYSKCDVQLVTTVMVFGSIAFPQND